ncbi:MAG: zf-HC2 domain-containing protein [Phycisphaerae bacterium]|nr:zf-HC2 domain-containing protein [Phycisphaerae bacterium]
MNCTECKELLVAHIEGLLDASQEQAVAEHLKDCSACKAEAETLRGLQGRLAKNGQSVAQGDLENDVMNLIVREQKVRLKAAEKAAEGLKLRRIIMKSRYAKVAAAAVIIIAVVIGLIPGNNVTFADVVKPILNAKTVILDMIIGADESGPTMHEIVVGSRIRRTMSNLPTLTQILDLDSGKMLVLESEGKTAGIVDISGTVQEGTKNYVEFLRQVIRQVQEGQVEKLGEQVIDGQKAIGFKGKGQNEEVTIWADAETCHPIRIELQVGSASVVMKNFEFDTVVDDALVSMDTPNGYTMQAQQFDLSGATEEDFVELLRIIWAEIIRDGTFPGAVSSEHIMKAMPVLVQKLTEMQLSEEEGTETGLKVGRGMLFHQSIDSQGNWHYAGANVKLGDADTAIFWYLPQGSQTYRVIYGDLTVKDVAEADLPK